MTPHRAVAVKLSLLAWLQVVGGVGSLLVVWTVAAVRYADHMDARIVTAQATADKAQASIDKIDVRADQQQQAFNQAVLQISGNVAEIKGQLAQMARDQRRSP